jgi:hypothetical protein
VDTQHLHANIQPTTACLTDLYLTSFTPVANPMNLADATIEWTDTNGLVWTSLNNGQPATSLFRVISCANYQANTAGQPTKKIHAQISCTLYNGTNSIPFNGDAVFSAAHL